MQKIRFCEGWTFGETGKEKTAVLLPHDATQLQGRTADAASGSGGAYYLDGTYEYTRTFTAPESWREQYVSLLFEGVYPRAKVLLNGQETGGCAYGYSQFETELKGLKYGEENELSVVVEHHAPNSRWYAGAGIYRPVWLLLGNAAHIPYDGIRVTTLSCNPAAIRVETAHTGSGQVLVEILEDGKTVGSGEGEDVTISIPCARLWDAESPNLYSCRATLKKGEELLDKAETVFGIRKIEYSPEGLFINGKKTLLKGGCIHSDNGILGARTFDESEWRRVRILKKWGFNAIRSAHNPLARATLEACDALGMYVMDETWDMWYKQKTANDYAERFAENWKYDVKAMAAKDYNHPSVILYSIGNEVTEPAEEKGVRLAGEIISEIKKHDVSRPVTGGINVTLLLMAAAGMNVFAGDHPDQRKEDKKGSVNSTDFNEQIVQQCEGMVKAAASEAGDRISAPVLDRLDIAGYNYAQSRYENDQALHPGRVVVGSETFPQDLPGNWALVEKYPWVIGDFMWTAWDYLGEVGIGAWTDEPEAKLEFAKPYPWKLGDTGALDILGNDTAEARMAAVVWDALKAPYIAVRPVSDNSWQKAMWRGSNAIPSWSWKGCTGKKTEVEVYTKAPEAELFVNGVSQGRKAVMNTQAVFSVIYQPGELKAVAYGEDGTRTESILRSADEHTRIAIQPESRPEPGKLLYTDISLRGENGEIESHADETLTVSVEGGKLLAFGSANPKTEEEYHTGTYTTYRGRALAAILPESDDLEIRAQGKTMQGIWKN